MRCSRPGAPARCSRSAQDRDGRLPRGDAQAGRDQGVGGLEGAGERQAHLDGDAAEADRQALALGRGLAGDQAQALARFAHRQHRLAVHHRPGGEGGEIGRVGVQHGGRAPRQQGFEKPQLGRPVGVHAGMVVEVVLAEVGEAGGGEMKAVQPPLVEAMGRGLDRQVGDTALHEPGGQAGDVAGVGRGQAGRRQRLAVQLQAEGAEAGGLAPQPGEDLAAARRRPRSCR